MASTVYQCWNKVAPIEAVKARVVISLGPTPDMMVSKGPPADNFKSYRAFLAPAMT